MRQGFLIAMVIFGIAIQMIGATLALRPMLSEIDTKVTDDTHPGGMTQQEILNSLKAPEIGEAGDTSIVFKSLKILKLLGKIIAFWHDEVWQGFGIYLYDLIVLPLTVSFWWVVISTLRGVGSG